MKNYISLTFSIVGLIISPFVYSQSLDTNLFNTSGFRNHLLFLASDKLEGRAPGTNGYTLALNYVDSLFSEFSLIAVDSENNQHGFIQEFELENYLMQGKSKITLNYDQKLDTFLFGEDFIPFHFGNLFTEIVQGEIAFVGDGVFEPDYHVTDYDPKEIAGKWLVMNEHIPTRIIEKLPIELQNQYLDIHTSSLLRAKHAYENGAIGIMFTPDKRSMALWNIRSAAFQEFNTTKNLGSPFRSASIPVLLIDTVLANTLILNKTKRLSLKLEKILEKRHTIKTHNISGAVQGSQPSNQKKYIIVGAHLDHIGKIDSVIYNGAEDNGSGTAAVIELARIISKSPMKHTLIFVLFSSEELGLLGSQYFVNNLNIKHENIIAMINIDMVGRLDGDANGIAPIVLKNKGFWKDIIESTNVTSYFDLEYTESFTHKNSGDHFPFYQKDIPTLFLTAGMNNDIHQPTDETDRIDFEFLAFNTKLIYLILKEIDNN